MSFLCVYVCKRVENDRLFRVGNPDDDTVRVLQQLALALHKIRPAGHHNPAAPGLQNAGGQTRSPPPERMKRMSS